MNYIIVIDDETNTINVTGNTEFEWYLTIIDGNFLLEKYSGIGTQSIKINPLPNLGDGLYGKVLLSTNDKSCDNSADANIEGPGFYFNVEPKYITLYRSGDTATINVSSTCTWTATTVSGAKFTMSPTNGSGNNSITITATSNDSFENVPITITDCNGLYETVYVTQKPQQVSSNLLTVNPQYISLSGDKKDFTVTVLSICNDGTDYTVTSNDNKITVTKNGNIINGNVNTTENFSGTITVSNACGLSKDVTIEYTKQIENEHYLWIVSSGNSEVDYTFTSDTTVSYDVLSSSNWYIYDYDSSKVNCSKSGNKINISLGEDKEACSEQVITLKNREGDIAKVIYSLGSGLIVETGVTFTFASGETEISVSAETDYTFTACIFAYKTENGTKKEIKWSNKSSAFNMIEGTKIVNSYTGGSEECQEVKFSATTSTKNSSFTDYTIRLQEQETFKEIKIKVKVNRSNQTNDEGYSITISPESGNYNLTEDFTVSVTPVYYYNGTEYYIKDDPKSEDFGSSLGGNFDDYKGVSAETTFNGVTVSSTDILYDSIVYHLNIPNGVTSFTACTTATTSGGVKDTSATACTEITFTSVTENGLCLFQSDVELIESGFESSTQMYSFVSQNDFVCVEYKYEYESGDTNWSNWLTIDDSDCENLKASFSENESTDERSVVLKFTQTGSNKCSEESILIEFKQYGDGSIFIPAFDYLVVRYFWGATEGDDLDTVTVISALLKADGTPLTGETLTKYPYIDNGVGWSHGTSITSDADTNRNDNRVVSGDSGVYLEHAGDNQDDGNECVYLNFKNLTDEESVRKMLNDGVSKIRIDLYGNWFNQKLNGRLDVSLLAYINGDMIDDPSDTYNFVNINGTEVLNTMTNTRVCTQGSGRVTQYKTQYTHIGYVEYNIKDKSAILVINEECEEATYELTNALTTTSITVNNIESTTNSISFNSTKDGTVFTDVNITSAFDWINNFTLTNNTNPLIVTFTVNKNTTSSERSSLVTVEQIESGKKINYQIKQPCTCEVTNISILPTTASFLKETDAQIFNLKVETTSCDTCTKGYTLYDPNGRLVTTGTGENTVNITYATAVKGDYKLVANDNTGKTATLSIDKFEAYYILCIRQTEEYVTCYTSTTINCSATPLPSELPKITYRTRYITGETEETDFIFVSGVTIESDCDWVLIEENDDYRVLDNNTYSARECTVTYTQPISNKKVYLYVKQAGLPATYTLNVSGASVSYDSTRAIVFVESLKNGEAYGSLMFDDDDANCDWVGTSLIESLSGGIYKYKFTIEKNTSTSSRSCSIILSQVNGKTKTFTITQEGAPEPPPQPTNCMNIIYKTEGMTDAVTIVFKTQNGDTQQGGGHEVYGDSTQELCCYGLDGTDLYASCSDTNITLGGDTAFTYNSGGTVTINVIEPHISKLIIQNNENGAANITVKDKNDNIIPITDEFGTPQTSFTLANRGDEQVFGQIFSADTKINVEYQTNQWCTGSSCFVYVEFQGKNILPRPYGQNQVSINPFDNGHKVAGENQYGACSGSVVCDVNGYQVIVNFIFGGTPSITQ